MKMQISMIFFSLGEADNFKRVRRKGFDKPPNEMTDILQYQYLFCCEKKKQPHVKKREIQNLKQTQKIEVNRFGLLNKFDNFHVSSLLSFWRFSVSAKYQRFFKDHIFLTCLILSNEMIKIIIANALNICINRALNLASCGKTSYLLRYLA